MEKANNDKANATCNKFLVNMVKRTDYTCDIFIVGVDDFEPEEFNTEQEAIDYCALNTSSYNTYTYKKSERTVRWLLQYVGTELFRDKLHQNLHVIGLFADYVPKFTGNVVKESDLGDESKWELPKWLVTDLRFPNEAIESKRRGGILIRVRRNFINGVYIHKGNVEHPSETALDNYQFDYEINNDGTIKQLVEMVKGILIKEKIL